MIYALYYSFFLLPFTLKFISNSELKGNYKPSDESVVVDFCLQDDLKPEMFFSTPSKKHDTVFRYLREGLSVPASTTDRTSTLTADRNTNENLESPKFITFSTPAASNIPAFSVSSAEPSKVTFTNSSHFKRLRLSGSSNDGTAATSTSSTKLADDFAIAKDSIPPKLIIPETPLVLIPVIPVIRNPFSTSPSDFLMSSLPPPPPPSNQISFVPQNVFTLHSGYPLSFGPVISYSDHLVQLADVIIEDQFSNAQESFVILYNGSSTDQVVQSTCSKSLAMKTIFSERFLQQKLMNLGTQLQLYPTLLKIILAIQVQNITYNLTAVTILIKEEYKFNVCLQNLLKKWDRSNVHQLFREWKPYL